MNQVIKSFKDIGPVASNYIGDRLSDELNDYGNGVNADMGRLLGISGGAVSRWSLGKNGINYTLAQKVGFLLGIPVDDLSDTGSFARPRASTHPYNPTEFAHEICERASTLRNKEFMVDVLGRAKKHLLTLQSVPEAVLPPKPPMASAEPSKPNFRDTVKGILATAEQFRTKNGIEWFVKCDGSLGAKRTVVEEF
jgi:hypothetical protein